MSDFKDFFNAKTNTEKTELASIGSKINNILMTASVTGLLVGSGKKEKAADEFSNKVSQFVHSDEFIGELSKDIGTPKENESEDEFVSRAKDAMKNLLRKQLSK